jgi:predicted DNA-binding transcriptional regulator YafY
VDALRATTEPATWGPPAASVDGDTLIAVAQACRDSERLDFDYTAAGDSLGRNWYLVAYDLTRHEWRSFRLDRLAAPRTTGTRFEPRDLPADDAAAFVRAGIAQVPRPILVDAVIAAPADAIRSRVGRWTSIDERADSTCRLRFSTESLDWATLALGATGADFAIQGPPELVEHLRTWTALPAPPKSGALVSNDHPQPGRPPTAQGAKRRSPSVRFPCLGGQAFRCARPRATSELIRGYRSR